MMAPDIKCWICFIIQFLIFSINIIAVEGHGSMMIPKPRQPESPYWYQVGCLIGCECSGGGKEMYPTTDSLNCKFPSEPTNNNVDSLTWNANGMSPRGEWNRYMPWRSPGSSKPIDSCGIASGFLPDATVQFPHQFHSNKNDGTSIVQGEKGTDLPEGPITEWEAGSIVEASFYLIVNHGGGYQYRVCPKEDGKLMMEECFENHPLSFASDFHKIVHGTKSIRIPAVDINEGVKPSGSTWRRLPIPACNCDIGTDCVTNDIQDSIKSYTESTDDKYGSCTTGLQFEAPHLKDGLWPEGYGYYVAALNKGTKRNESKCSTYSDESSCIQDTQNGCLWYTEKNTCYETRKHDKSTSMTKECDSIKDEKTCVQTDTTDGNKCTWYEGENKKVCYDYEKYVKSIDSSGSKLENDKIDKTKNNDISEREFWHITDQLFAPTLPGEYLLQWRWDNEQTPQIWTTCADISVISKNDATSGTTRNHSYLALAVNTVFIFLVLYLFSEA